MAFGHTWTPTASIVNDVRYGFIRQGYSSRGVGTGTGDWVDFRFLDQPNAQALTTVVNVPVHNITDNFTWTKGAHTLNLGGNWRGITNNRGTDANSYTNASTNPYWMSRSRPSAPADLGSGFSDSYEIAYDTLVGTVPETTQQYNYSVTSPTTGTLYPDGAFIDRHFKANEFEYYVQDSWRIKPNLTVTYGIRHSLLQAPYETNGQQIAPTVDTHDWFSSAARRRPRATSSKILSPSRPAARQIIGPDTGPSRKPTSLLDSPSSGRPIHAPAFASEAACTIDHFGQGIVNTFDQKGSFGLSSSIISPAGNYSVEDAPRFTGPHDIPPLAGCTNPASTITYPFTPSHRRMVATSPLHGASTTISRLPIPMTSISRSSRNCPAASTVEVNYVGRLGRHLLDQLDLAEPVDLVDKQGGGDYFPAAAELSKISDQNGGCNPYSQNPCAVPNVPLIKYFEDIFPQMQDYDYPGESATQAIYNNEWAPYRYDYGETTALADLDFYCYYGCPNGTQFWQSQFSSLYAWSSIGTSSYNAMQFTLRHPTSHGLTPTSTTRFPNPSIWARVRSDPTSSLPTLSAAPAIQNSWNPKLNKGPSDFDTRHLAHCGLWSISFPSAKARHSSAEQAMSPTP